MAGNTRDEIHATLHRLHAAQTAGDVEAMLQTYATAGFVNLEDQRHYFEQMVEQGAFREREVDMSRCETFIWREVALVKPVIYRTGNGLRCSSYHLAKEQGGAWRIIASNRSQLRDEMAFTPELVANAGKVVGTRGMLWVRRLDVPIGEVWTAISTSESLGKWWIGKSVDLDLRAGGLFRHHWTNSVRDFREKEYIDFVGIPGDGAMADNLMRFEIRPDGDGSVFLFFDAFRGATSPLTLPWTAAGWHGTVDALETLLTGRSYTLDFGIGGEFYWRHLRDFHQIAAMEDDLAPAVPTMKEWRDAYLVESC